MKIDGVGPAPQQSLVVRDGFAGLAALAEGVRKVEARIIEVRICPQGTLQITDGFIDLPLHPEDRSKAVERRRIIRFKTQGPSIRLGSVVQFAVLLKRDGQILIA